MSFRSILVGLVLTVLPATMVLAADAPISEADKNYAEGEALLKKGEFDLALKAFALAAKDDLDNDQYRGQYMLVRRVIKMRKAVAREKNPQKWWQTAVALRSFYYKYDLYEEILALALQMHERKKTPESATVLADAYLALNRNADAEKAMVGVQAKDRAPQAQALLGIAQARQGKVEAAKGVLDGIEIPEGSGPRFLLDMARLRLLCGDQAGCLATLTTTFESTTPSALPTLKTFAKSLPDFASLAKSEQFAKVMKTESKVPESSCSGGSSCSSCANRGSCPSSSSSASPSK
jgi:tetratricopeptide (TPR) repeat protein